MVQKYGHHIITILGTISLLLCQEFLMENRGVMRRLRFCSGLGDCGNAPPSGQARAGGKPWLDPHSVFWKVTTCFIRFQKEYILTFRHRLYYLLQEIMWVTLFASFFSVREAFRRKVKFHHNAKPQSRCFQTHWVVLCWF